MAIRVQKENALLNADQRVVVDSAMAAVNTLAANAGRAPRVFFVDSPGGCGKTFVFNRLLVTVCERGDIALAVAGSSIAALLLDGGSTAHSCFGIPIQLKAQSSPNIGLMAVITSHCNADRVFEN